MLRLSEKPVLKPANSGNVVTTNHSAAPTREIVPENRSGDAGTRDSLIPTVDLEHVAFAALTLCDSTYAIHCGLTVVPAGRAPETVAATDDVAVRVDWLQHELRQGPGLDAHSGELLTIKDLAADRRWPDFGRMCVAVMNICSMVSVRIPLPTGDRASLNFYSSEPKAFERLQIGSALSLARLTAPRVANLITEFRELLLAAARSDYSRVAIAVGTVVARHRVSPSDAFDLLCEAGHDLDRALLDVAIETATNGRLPEGAIIRARGQHRAESRPGQQRSHAATSPRVRHRVSGLTASGARRSGRETDANGRPSVGGPEMWRDPSRR